MATPNQEDYLEAIYRIVSGKGYARVADIAESLHVSQASVSRMIRKLNLDGMLDVEKYRGLALTPEGAERGQTLIRRHSILDEFLRNLGVKDPGQLLKDVEGIEHYCSPPTLKLLESLNQFIQLHPNWWKTFTDSTPPPGK